ncbi:MAG: TIM barrel protein [Phycisphaerae bacterium]
MKPVSLQLYSVREQLKEDFCGTLEKVAGFGYVAVEGGRPSDRSPEELKKVLDDLGLAVSSAHWALTTEENVSEVVDFAGLFGISVIVSGWNREAWDTVDGIREAADALQAAAELLGSHGLQQAYHNHWWEMRDFDGKRGLEIFLENAPDVHAQLDVYWACRFGEVDVPALLGRWNTRCSTLHIKDGPLIEGQPHTAVGAGRMDIPAVIGAADENTLKWLIVELDHCATDMLTAVRESIDYLTANGLGEGRAPN